MKGNQLNWNQLFYFCQVAHHGSITEAAAKLNLATSTLSEQVSELESSLRVKLFDRAHRRLSLTEQGRRLFQHSRGMFEASQRLIDVVSPVELGCYPVAVGLVPGPSSLLANRIVGAYLSQFGVTDLRIITCSASSLERGLYSARFDFGFTITKPLRKDLIAYPVATSRLAFFVSDTLAKEDFSQLALRLPLLFCGLPNRVATVRELLNQHDISLSGIVSEESSSLLYHLCEQGRGIGLFNADCVKAAHPRLQEVRTNIELPEDSLYLVWAPEAEQSEAVARLRDLVREIQVQSPWTWLQSGTTENVRAC